MNIDAYKNIHDAPDASKKDRPGVPLEKEFAPSGNAHWTIPDKQTPRGLVLKDAQRTELTATFGTGSVLRGVSGLLRRAAYRMPDYHARRWALLLFADRVDGYEDRAKEFLTTPTPWILAGLAMAVWGAVKVRGARAFL